MTDSTAFLAALALTAVFAAVVVALMVRDWRIDHGLDGLDLTDDDAPSDDSDHPPDPRTTRRRINGDH